MTILGISAFYHDSAAAIIRNGEIIAAAQEERFSRIKHDSSFPTRAVQFCLQYAGTSINELDAIAYYDKPLLKFERLLETYYAFAPRGLGSFIKAIPIWLRDKLFLKRLIYQSLREIESFDKKKVNLIFPEHHLSHAASSFFASPFQEAAILTIDGVGEWATATIAYGRGHTISQLRELRFPHSLGLLYSAFTYFLGFQVNSGEYKLMGLAPYGDPSSHEVQEFIEKIESQLVHIKSDGSIWLNQEFFTYSTGLKMIPEKKWQNLFGFSPRVPESEILQPHCNLAFAIQHIIEKIVQRMAIEAQKLTKSTNLCMAGGVALNCVANGKLRQSKCFEHMYIQPASGDAGGALGAALAAYHIFFDRPREMAHTGDLMLGTYLGPDFSELEVELMARKYKAPYQYLKWEDEENPQHSLPKVVAQKISEGNVLGWMQGRMEFGPRALGARSILADPRNPETQKRLNLKIKYRESFRPFAPAVLLEDSEKYFDLEGDSPYMLFTFPLHASLRTKLPEDFFRFSAKEKRDFQKSAFPAITHIDYSARVQTVKRADNPKFWELLKELKELTGIGMVVNTSFNVRGEPIVCTPEDAYACFMNTEMDYLVIGNFLFSKQEQNK